MTSNKGALPTISPMAALIDLIIFLSMMFFIRTLYFPSLNFWGNAMVNSVATLSVATALLYFRGQSWKSMGLVKPGSYKRVLIIAAGAFVATLGSIMVYEGFLSDLLFPVSTPEIGGIASVETEMDSGSRFPDAGPSLLMYFGVILIIWLESFFEELQDRGFSLNRFESLLSKIPFSIIFAVIAQAAVFGYRHSPSHGLSGAMVVGIIGLVFGIIYVATGRNLWPLIIVHCLLNTISMWDKI